jgi:hypothetical protein
MSLVIKGSLEAYMLVSALMDENPYYHRVACGDNDRELYTEIDK